MFWADKVALELKKRKLPLEWVDDMKTPSGKIHVGSLRGIVIHDLVNQALKKQKVNTKFTYVFDDHDPMDDVPVYLPEDFKKYLGMPLFKIPSPDPKFDNFAKCYALEFKDVFNKIGSNPEILWSSELYLSGKMNDVIRACLDKAQIIRDIYSELYKKEIAKEWLPFQPYCPSCGKVSTTKATDWNNDTIGVVCEDKLKFKGCGFKGRISPFSTKDNIAGKLPWKVEWPCKWKVLGITVEGAGKDHMSAGGSHDLAKLICRKVLDFEVPYPITYEFFLTKGKKMSSSKGLGSTASEMLEILPPEILRFLMVKTKINQAINFDPQGETIPKLFDDYQKFSNSKDPEEKRVFELSQVPGGKKAVPRVRFSELVGWVQSPNMESKAKEAQAWIPYAKIWLERFAPEETRFAISKEIPENSKKLTVDQKKYLHKIVEELDKDWKPEELQKKLYEWTKELKIPSQKGFSAIYLSLFGKNYGPKAAWIILENKEIVKKRFQELQSE